MGCSVSFWAARFIEGERIMEFLPQHITKAVADLTEEQAKQLLVEILIAKNYSNQEVLFKVQEVLEQLVR